MSRRFRKFRLLYWAICIVLLFFAVRYLLRYQQMINDAIHFNDKK